jgi:hypothetical protein
MRGVPVPEGVAGDQRYVVEIEFNQQQDVILERLRELGEYGTTDAEIVRNVFQEFLRHTRV